MVNLAEKDFEAFQKMGIIEVREKFLEDLNEKTKV
jgi:hypothetical protein